MPLGPRTAALAAVLSVTGLGGFASTVATEHGIPARAVEAYVTASQAEGCDWRDLAAVGWKESGHGTSGGRHLDDDGVMTPALIIWDVIDYGGGPMGFLDSTWNGGGYEAAFPGGYQDMDQAARATCRYLQAKGYAIGDPAARWSAFKSYNGTGAAAEAYATSARDYADALPPADGVVGEPTGGQADELGGTRRRTLGETVEAMWQHGWDWLDKPQTPTLARFSQWVAPGQRTDKPAAVPPVEAQGRAQAVVEFAVAQVGKEYVWGAESDEEGGFDCSGLVWAAYMAAGVNLNGGRSTADYQILEGGARIVGDASTWPAKVRAGDLLGFDGGDPPWGHIGLAISATEMVDARGTAYGVVRRPIPYDLLRGVTRPLEQAPVAAV